ncbi:MAG: hypothetical protein U0837_14670 [Dehalococcoidia bacterium]
MASRLEWSLPENPSRSKRPRPLSMANGERRLSPASGLPSAASSVMARGSTLISNGPWPRPPAEAFANEGALEEHHGN